MSKGSPEEIKIASHGLRGTIAQTLVDPAVTHLDDSDNVLLKHHGSYQQDDRDLRAQLSKEKKEKAWKLLPPEEPRKHLFGSAARRQDEVLSKEVVVLSECSSDIVGN